MTAWRILCVVAVALAIFTAPAYARQKHNNAKPAKWCGWFMRHQVPADPGPQFNLARKWKEYGYATAARIGAIVVWPHHVGLIVGRSANGQWLIHSGNDGGRVRTRPRSVAGAIAFRLPPSGIRFAQN